MSDDDHTPDDPTPLRKPTDADIMRALAHPSRVALWELLVVHGPMTATQAAEHVDDSPSNCSFHLRRLAKYGLVEEADGVGTGRARPWRVTKAGYSVSSEPGDSVDTAVAAETLSSVVVDRAVDRQKRWQRHSRDADEQERRIAGVAQTVWWVTEAEAIALRTEINALAHRFHRRLSEPATRPENARPFEFLALLHPFDDEPPPGETS